MFRFAAYIMADAIDYSKIVGKRFGSLIVLSEAPSRKYAKWATTKMLNCQCDCGNTVVKQAILVYKGKTINCGSSNHERKRAKYKGRLQGLSYSTLYKRYQNIITRCSNKNTKDYKNYGGRGITVCDRWLGKDGFINFYNDMGYPPKGKSIDRIDVNGNYCKENCRWATPVEQRRNQRNLGSIIITHNGVSKSIIEWAIVSGLHKRTLYARIRQLGWTIEDSLNKKSLRKNGFKNIINTTNE